MESSAMEAGFFVPADGGFSLSLSLSSVPVGEILLDRERERASARGGI